MSDLDYRSWGDYSRNVADRWNAISALYHGRRNRERDESDRLRLASFAQSRVR